MVALSDTADRRHGVYGALRTRNRRVGMLRLVVPGLGVAIFALLLVPIVLAQLGPDFSIGRISIDRDQLTVEAPSYAGLILDGSAYRIGADSARAALGVPNLIDLTGATVVVKRPNGVDVTALAAAAQLDTNTQSVTVAGATTIADTTGMDAMVEGMRVDFPGEMITSSGPVRVKFAGGETMTAGTMSYDAAATVWQFTNVVITLPGVPGADSAPLSVGGEVIGRAQ